MPWLVSYLGSSSQSPEYLGVAVWIFSFSSTKSHHFYTVLSRAPTLTASHLFSLLKHHVLSSLWAIPLSWDALISSFPWPNHFIRYHLKSTSSSRILIQPLDWPAARNVDSSYIGLLSSKGLIGSHLFFIVGYFLYIFCFLTDFKSLRQELCPFSLHLINTSL